MTERWSYRIVQWTALFMTGGFVLLFLFLTALRLLYPYEVEWHEGAIMDLARRIAAGKGLYAPPTIHYAAFAYTPLYYYIVAGLSALFGEGLWIGRVVSLVCTFVTALVAGGIAYRETSRSRTIALFAVGVYLGYYRQAGYFFDIVRMDAMAVMLVALGLYALLYWKRGEVWSAIFLAAAYLTKQQMLLVAPALLVVLGFAGQRKALVFGSVWFGLVSISILLFTFITNGWYWYYTFTIPAAKSRLYFSWLRAIEFLPTELLGVFGLALAVIAIGLFLHREIVRPNSDRNLLLAALAAAIVIAMLGIGYEGGYRNVYMPMLFMLAVLVPISAFEIAQLFHRPIIAPLAMTLVYLTLVYDPTGEKMLLASPRQRAAGDEFIARLRQMPGEVYLPFHGYLGHLAGKLTHLHFMAMSDVLLCNDTTAQRLQRDLDNAFVSHRFSTVIADENPAFPDHGFPHYARVGQLFKTPNVFISRLGDAGTRPQFIYTPAP